MTAIIYALTLGSVIFLLTSANLEVQTITAADTIGDADIVIKGFSVLTPKPVDTVLLNYKSSIKDWAYITDSLSKFANSSDNTWLMS